MKHGSYEDVAADIAQRRLLRGRAQPRLPIVSAATLQKTQDPSAKFVQLANGLPEEGEALVEVPNLASARNRLRHLGRKLPTQPVKTASGRVEHNPHTVMKQLAHAGLKVERTLSVGNVPSPLLVRALPRKLVLAIEKPLQKQLAGSYSGARIFFLVKKA